MKNIKLYYPYFALLLLYAGTSCWFPVIQEPNEKVGFSESDYMDTSKDSYYPHFVIINGYHNGFHRLFYNGKENKDSVAGFSEIIDSLAVENK